MVCPDTCVPPEKRMPQDALFKLGAVSRHIHKGQLKFDGAIEEIQKTAPFFKNGGLVGNSLGTFRHKQDSTLVAEQTTIFSVSIFLRVNI